MLILSRYDYREFVMSLVRCVRARDWMDDAWNNERYQRNVSPVSPESHDYVALSVLTAGTAIEFLEPLYMTFVITSANIVLLNVIYHDGR